jgi:hypothetical protein
MINSDCSLVNARGVVPVLNPHLDLEARLAAFRIAGTKSTFNGPHMVAAVTELLSQPGGLGPTYQNKLREAFFRYFGSTVADDPEAEFDAALDRAVELGLVWRVNPDAAKYADLFVCGLWRNRSAA